MYHCSFVSYKSVQIEILIQIFYVKIFHPFVTKVYLSNGDSKEIKHRAQNGVIWKFSSTFLGNKFRPIFQVCHLPSHKIEDWFYNRRTDLAWNGVYRLVAWFIGFWTFNLDFENWQKIKGCFSNHEQRLIRLSGMKKVTWQPVVKVKMRSERDLKSLVAKSEVQYG